MFTTNAPAPQRRTLVLLSGGIDSATVLALARLNTCKMVHTVTFNYSQESRKQDHTASGALARHYDTTHNHVYMPSLASFSGLTGDEDTQPDLRKSEYTETAPKPEGDVPLLPVTWKPGRNIMFLSWAGAYAWDNDINVIALGVHQEDYPGYPDCRQEFLQNMEFALRWGLSHPVEIWAPLLYMNKKQILELGFKLKVPYELTWSCYEGGEKPCYTCDACTRRAEAFNACRKKDPVS